MLMSLLYVYILSMGAAEMAVNASFLIHLEQGDPHANFSLRHRYRACTFFSLTLYGLLRFCVALALLWYGDAVVLT